MDSDALAALSASLLVIIMDAFTSIVDTSATSLYISLLSISFNPTAWNVVARNGKPDRRA